MGLWRASKPRVKESEITKDDNSSFGNMFSHALQLRTGKIAVEVRDHFIGQLFAP